MARCRAGVKSFEEEPEDNTVEIVACVAAAVVAALMAAFLIIERRKS